MGLRGLFTVLTNDVKSDRKSIVIYPLGTDKSDIQILVDFNSFQRFLVETISTQLARKYDNDYLLFPSGEYDILKNAFSEFHTAFKEAGINLVWIIDGPKGIDKVASARKKSTWIERDDNDIKHLNEVLDCAKYKTYPRDLNNLGPLSGFSKCIEGLKAVNAEVIQLLQGEADDFLAYEYHRRRSFAIISDDTDHLVFSDLKVIFPKFMKLEYGDDNTNLPFIAKKGSRNIFTKFEKFQCPIVEQKRVCEILQLSGPRQLITLSIFMGNDKSEEYAPDLRKSLQIPYNRSIPLIKAVAKCIAEHEGKSKDIWKIPKVQAVLKRNSIILEAIDFSYKYYTLQHLNENLSNSLVTYEPISTDCSTLTGFLRIKLSNSEINSAVYSIHCGIFNETILPERNNPDYPSIATIMADIRAQLYPYLLDENLNEVLEWRPRSRVRENRIPVEHSVFKTNEIKGKPEPDTERSGPIIYGIDLFEKVWSHLEREDSLEYFTKFGLSLDLRKGLRKGFICYILRYLYQITNNKNLNISKDEFRALFITVFYQHGISEGKIFETKIEREEFLRSKICPTERCLIIFSWFMNVYYTGKYLTGGAFNLTADLPGEENVINGSSFYAFYESIRNERNTGTLIQDSIETLGEEIMEQYHEEYALITK